MSANALADKIKQLATQHELFLYESHANNYQPAPPVGWFAMRSHKRRIFLQRIDDRIPNGEIVQSMINAKEYHEHPLT